jgi:hypothetical protein
MILADNAPLNIWIAYKSTIKHHELWSLKIREEILLTYFSLIGTDSDVDASREHPPSKNNDRGSVVFFYNHLHPQRVGFVL